jgi:hypothetical protein
MSAMNVKQQVNGLNEFLTTVYGTETRLSTLLTSLGFNSQQVELIRNQYLERAITSFLESLRKRMVAGWDGERLYKIISRRFGLDGEPPDTLETLGQQFGLSRERIRQLEYKAIKKCTSKANQQFLKTSLHSIALKLIGDVTERPSPEGITVKLDKLTEIRAAADLTRADYEAKRAEILGKVQSELDALEAEYAPLLQASSEHADSIMAEIKNDVLRHGTSVRTDSVQAVYAKGRISWDAKGLGQYAEAHPDIMEYRKQGEPTVSIRFVQKHA